MKDEVWTLIEGDGPLVATAIHDGHALRDELVALSDLPETDRLREEDPYTGEWTGVAETRIVVSTSRFEVDLNRPRERAVYLRPEDAWGLNLWKAPLPRDVIERSHSVYDAFYSEVERVLKKIESHHGRFVVFDLHSFNHRREGPSGPEADPKANPEVNIGTGAMPEGRWEGIVSRFMSDLSSYNFIGRHLDVRENIKFRGGNFPRWVHKTFPNTGCAIAVEFKKFFMDEWTGVPDRRQIQEIHKALASTVSGILEGLAGTGIG